MDQSNQVSEHLLIGLPATGKTTFLAALWHLLESSEIAGALSLLKLQGDREYINGLTRKWERCESMPRTPITTQTLVSMRLRDAKTGKEMDVHFPDLSGEVFKQQWIERSWSTEYGRLVANAAGVLLFVHPERISEPHRIDEANQLVVAAGGELNEQGRSAVPPVQWSHELAPDQVVLTDLLQCIQMHRGPHRPLKLAVMISAWDTVVHHSSNPTKWFNARLSLLAQFLECNDSFWPSRIYGVSAQGGDLDKDKARLLQHDEPSERVKISGPETTEHDLTDPLKWLMS